MRNLLLIPLLVLALTRSGAAQDATPDAAPSPFLQALALVPDTPLVRGADILFSYADYHAAFAARRAELPVRLANLLDDPAAYGAVTAALPLTGLLSLTKRFSAGGRRLPQTVGFDFFDIGRSVEIGAAPQTGQILLGNFSADAVEAAYTARGYGVERSGDSGILLCAETGCETGMQLDLDSIELGNPFNGDLGHREPGFVSDGVLLNSPHLPLLEAMTAAHEGRAASLADAPEVQALDAVLSAYPHVISVMALSPRSTGAVSVFTADEASRARLTDEITAVIEAMPLAPFQIAAVAAAETNEYGLAMLVYGDRNTAQAAAAVIGDRLSAMRSAFIPHEFYIDALSRSGTLEPPVVISHKSTGLSVIVLRISRPLPLNERDAWGQMPGSYIPYWHLHRMCAMGDKNWLIWNSSAA